MHISKGTEIVAQQIFFEHDSDSKQQKKNYFWAIKQNSTERSLLVLNPGLAFLC